MPELEIGRVDDYFAQVGVAGIKLTGSLKVSDTIHIKGHTTDLQQLVSSMQIDRQDVEKAGSGDSIGVKVSDRVRRGDHVYKVTE